MTNEKKPRSPVWKRLGPVEVRDRSHPTAPPVPCGTLYSRGRLRVISQLADAELPGPDGGVGPTWIVSVSVIPRGRATDEQLERVRRDFDLVDAEEDNHSPGITRTLFLPVDPALRGVCECKSTEDVVVEPDGYTWTNPTPESGESCRGCENLRMYTANGLRAVPCPFHGTTLEGLRGGPS